MKSVLRAYKEFWFKKADGMDLGQRRFLFFLCMVVLYFDNRIFLRWLNTPAALWQPVSVFHFFNLPRPTLADLSLTVTIWKVALALSCVGLFSRVATTISALGAIYLFSLRYCYGFFKQNDAILVLTMMVLAFSRCGDRFSLDSILRKRLKFRSLSTESTEYFWPVQAVRSLWVLTFFSAGLAKISYSGISYVSADSIINSFQYLAQVIYLKNEFSYETMGIAHTIAQFPTLCTLLAFGTLTLELSAPLAMFSKKAATFIVPALLTLLVGIQIVMGKKFLVPFSVAAIFWLPRAWLPIKKRI